VPVSVPLPLSSCELPCRHVHQTKGPPAFRVRLSIGLFLEPDETGIEKPSERFSRQAVGYAQDVGVAPLATAHDISSIPPRLNPPSTASQEKVADRPLHPSPRLELFFPFRVQCPKGNFPLCDSGFAQAAQERSTNCILRASHATWVPSARMMALPIRCCIVAHHFCPKRTYYRDVLNCFVSSQVGRALIDALEKVQASATRHCAGPVRLLEQWTVNRKTSHGSLNREELSSIQQHRQ
jgi:hypothetical protein